MKPAAPISAAAVSRGPAKGTQERKESIMSIRRSRNVVLATLAVLAVAAVTVVLASEAPLGTYTATMGGTTASTGVMGRGRGFRRGRTTSGATAGTQVTITVNSYSSPEELDQLAAVQQDPNAFLQLLSSFQHGTVTIGSQSFPINAAYSTAAGTTGNIIYIVSSRPFTSSNTSRRGRRAMGTAGGYIRLTVNAEGSGEGVLYSSAQVAISTDGTFTAKAGGTTATQLTGVTRK